MISAKHVSLLALAGGYILISACATTGEVAPASAATPVKPWAGATLLGGDGAPHGTATVAQNTDGLLVTVQATGLTPGVHAVHIHTTGACTPPDFTSAGGHWNPTGRHHGSQNPEGMHMGDMPNMTVDASGAGTLSYTIPGGTLTDGATPLLDADGAAAVIHAGPDDLKSDPAGNAGGRVACGVLKLN